MRLGGLADFGPKQKNGESKNLLMQSFADAMKRKISQMIVTNTSPRKKGGLKKINSNMSANMAKEEYYQEESFSKSQDRKSNSVNRIVCDHKQHTEQIMSMLNIDFFEQKSTMKDVKRLRDVKSNGSVMVSSRKPKA